MLEEFGSELVRILYGSHMEVKVGWIDAALAVQRGARLVTGDPDFRPLEVANLLTIHWLARIRV